MANLPERMRILRKEKRLTQQHMADFLEITLRAYQYYEAGGRRPDLEVLVVLADFFEVSLDYLVGRSETREFRP